MNENDEFWAGKSEKGIIPWGFNATVVLLWILCNFLESHVCRATKNNCFSKEILTDSIMWNRDKLKIQSTIYDEAFLRKLLGTKSHWPFSQKSSITDVRMDPKYASNCSTQDLLLTDFFLLFSSSPLKTSDNRFSVFREIKWEDKQVIVQVSEIVNSFMTEAVII